MRWCFLWVSGEALLAITPNVELYPLTPRVTDDLISLKCIKEEFVIRTGSPVVSVGYSSVDTMCGQKGTSLPTPELEILSIFSEKFQFSYHECGTIVSLISRHHTIYTNNLRDADGNDWIVSCQCKRGSDYCEPRIYNGSLNTAQVRLHGRSGENDMVALTSYSSPALYRKPPLARDLLLSSDRHTFTVWSTSESSDYLWPLECSLKNKFTNFEARIISNGCALTNRVDLSIHKSYASQERRKMPSAPKGHLSFSLNIPTHTHLICQLGTSSQPLNQDAICGPKRLRQKVNSIVIGNANGELPTHSSSLRQPEKNSPPATKSSLWGEWEAPSWTLGNGAPIRKLGTTSQFQEELAKRLHKLSSDDSTVPQVLKEQLDQDSAPVYLVVPQTSPLMGHALSHAAALPGADSLVGSAEGYFDYAKKGPIFGRISNQVKWDKWDASLARDSRLGDTAVSVGNKNSVQVSQSVGVKNRSVDTSVKYKDTVSVDAGQDLELDQYHVGTFVKGYGVGIKRENDQDATGLLVDTPNVTVGVMSNVLDRNYGGRLKIHDLEIMARHDFDQHIYEDRRKMASEFSVKTPHNVGVAVGTDLRQEKFGVGLGINGTQVGAMADLDDRQLKLTTNWKNKQSDPWHYYVEADLPDSNSRAAHAAVGLGRTDKNVVTAGGGIGNDGIPEFMARWSGKDAAVQVHLDDKTNARRKLITGFSFGRFTYVWDSTLLLENIPIPLLGGFSPSDLSHFIRSQ